MGVREHTPRIEISDDGAVRFSTLIEEGKSKVARSQGSSGAAPDQKPLPKSKSEHILEGARRVSVVPTSEKPDMEFRAGRRIIHGVAPTFALLLLSRRLPRRTPRLTISGTSRSAILGGASLAAGSMVARRSSIPVRVRRRRWPLPITIAAMPIRQRAT